MFILMSTFAPLLFTIIISMTETLERSLLISRDDLIPVPDLSAERLESSLFLFSQQYK